jgi:hypothetical protein
VEKKEARLNNIDSFDIQVHQISGEVLFRWVGSSAHKSHRQLFSSCVRGGLQVLVLSPD